MDILSILLISVSLAMDAFAVSITCGIKNRNNHFKTALKIALLFGIFQAIMPLIGWLIGNKLKEIIQPIDHWIIFGLLTIIGGKMIYESIVIQKEEKKYGSELPLFFLLGLAFATSIDALAAGFSFVFLHSSITLPIIIIGVITFLFSLLGFYIGGKTGSFFENRFEAIGGIILITIGTKILIEHLGA